MELFSPETLECLIVWSGLYALRLVEAFIQAGTQLDNLSQLSVSLKSTHFPDLFNFLVLCPNLEGVEVSFWRGDSDVDLPALPASTVPRLKSFSGPNVAAKVFVPGRPVTKIEVQSQYFATDTQQFAALSPLLFACSKSTETLDELFLKPAYPTKDPGYKPKGDEYKPKGGDYKQSISNV